MEYNNKMKKSKLIYHMLFVCFLLTINISVYCAEPDYGSNSSAGSFGTVNGVRLYYEIYGKGDVLLMLHAGIGSIADFQQSIGYFSRYYRVIAVDTRGHGRSGHDDTAYGYARFADDMIKLMDQLQVKRFYIIGFSDGGVTGYHLAFLYPERVRKLVAAGANYRLDGMTKSTKFFVDHIMVPEALETHSFWNEPRKLYKKLNPEPDGFNAHIERSRKMWIDDPYIAPERFAAIKVPVLLVFGDRDAISFEHIMHMYHSLNSETTQLCILPNAYHHVFLAKAAVLNPIILEFLMK